MQSIAFETLTIPPADAGRLYNVVIRFLSTGDAALPDRFELVAGVLPTGVTLERDREDLNFDGLPDEDGAFTGNARLLGVPRQRGSYSFTIKAISTGDLDGVPGQPDLAASQAFSVNVGEGVIAILTPTAEEGTSDPAVPAFPSVVSFVNPADPEAFFAFPFLLAGGSNNNIATVYLPREFGLSTFDASVVDSPTLHADVDESTVPGAPATLSPFEQNISDGGVFVLQAGQQKVQIGGFQSPRGPVREDGADPGEDITATDPAFLTGLLPIWFQDVAVPKSSRRDLADTLQLGAGDNTLGTLAPVQFTDYFNAGYKTTTPPDYQARYPFTADQYLNAFFVPYTAGVDLTPLAYRIIVEAVDTRGTPTNRLDDVIARKAYIVRVQIPEITIDTVLLPAGQAGVLYTEQIALSGGVPPLFVDLEWVDATNDLEATTGDALTKSIFGIELDPTIWRFIGAPRAAAPDTDPSTITPDGNVVELTIRAWAQVMNPVQSSASQIPTGGDGEFDGMSPVTGKKGRHRTIPWNVALPSAPVVGNAALAAGIDGVAYPGDRITGSGGVPRLAPDPVGFFDANPGAVYPAAAAQRAYEWTSTYVQDTSPGNTPGAVVAGLPYNLTLIGDASVATNGTISGTPFDRGYHPVTVTGTDFYIGLASAPDVTAFQQVFNKLFTISVSPDEAVYLKGTSGTGNKTNGLNQDDQMSEARMVPLLLATALFNVQTGSTPTKFTGLPDNFDTLPVLMPNGGTDSHNQMSVPQVRGFWPAEANKEQQWYYYPGAGVDQSWKHLQQEFTWLQSPDANHSRVFMWAESPTVANWNSSYSWNQRYQQLDFTKRRGVFVLNPRTGKVHVPAVLNPAADPDHGLLFGAEVAIGVRTAASAVAATGAYNFYEHGFYTKTYYYAIGDTKQDRQAHIHGGNAYIQGYSTSTAGSTSTLLGYYMMPLGRTATSVAMSADGKWCATALVGNATGGANEQKILLWRTDNQPIPAAILSRTFAEGVPGFDESGTAFTAGTERAVILKVGGELAGVYALSSDQRHLLPDSLMFVENGLVFLNETQLDKLFGVSLIDGHLSSIDINVSRVGVNGASVGPAVYAPAGQFVPDNDKVAGCVPNAAHFAQFSFAGNKPAAGEEGPKKIAFVAGVGLPTTTSTSARTGGWLEVITDAALPTAQYPRQGYANVGNANKSLYFMDLNTTGATGLELSTSTLRDLTGNTASVYGDLLTPGRFGEESDRLVLSDDGSYAAVVRDCSVLGSTSAAYYGYYGSFATSYYYYIIGSPSSYDGWLASHDLLVVSTSGADMHSGTGTQHVLFLGTGQHGNQYSTASAKGGMPAYAVQAANLNGSVKRIFGLAFTPSGDRVVMNYAASDYYIPTGGYPYAINWQMWNPSYTSYATGYEISLSLKFRNGASPENFTSTSTVTNNLAGLSGTSGVGPTAAPFSNSAPSVQNFWANFKSEDGRFMYYISDQIDGSLTFTSANRNFMVGFNMTSAAIGAGTAVSPVRQPFTPFITHPATIGFEQFDCNAWNYEGRFAASPSGIMTSAGQDATGILCVIANDASAGAGSATDLEVYVMNTNLGTNLFALTSSVTTGTANAINHLYLSCDGNVLAGQIAKTATSSASTRGVLNNTSDLFVVTNIHAVLGGATPNAVILSTGQSHGATVAFVGDGTPAGPQALVFSSGAGSSSNASWVTRTLKSAFLASGVVPSLLDNTQSHYVVLAGGRKVDDDPITAN